MILKKEAPPKNYREFQKKPSRMAKRRVRGGRERIFGAKFIKNNFFRDFKLKKLVKNQQITTEEAGREEVKKKGSVDEKKENRC